MGKIVTLADAHAQGLGQQKTKAGSVLKSKKQLEHESLVLYKAQQEETRQKAMVNWYKTFENYVLGLATELGFPAHAGLAEKREKIIEALLHQAALVIAGDKDAPTSEVWGATFSEMIDAIKAKDKEEKALIRTDKMASIVAAVIYDPSLDNGALEKALEEPWLGLVQKNKGVTREAREGEAFGTLAGVKLHDQAAAAFLRRNLDQAKDYTPAALKLGLDRLLPELAAELNPPTEAPVETPAPQAEEDARIA